MKSGVRHFRLPALALLLALGAGSAFAQHQAAPAPPSKTTAQKSPQPAQQQKQQQKAQEQQAPSQGQAQPGINEEFGQPLAEQSREAAGGQKAEKEEGVTAIVENIREEGKQSYLMTKLSRVTGLSRSTATWLSIVLDFAILAALIIFALKKNLPAMFRSRTATIQHGIEEARKASAEANQRLADIETRLTRLDQEVAAMRGIAEQEAAAEEQRILAAAEEERRRIVEAATAEIAAAEKLARRELKAYTADLAVTLAERRIRIDDRTDKLLVRNFAAQLGSSDSNGGKPGKDGQ